MLLCQKVALFQCGLWEKKCLSSLLWLQDLNESPGFWQEVPTSGMSWRFPRFADIPFSGLTARAALFSPPQGAAPAWEQSTFYLPGGVAA